MQGSPSSTWKSGGGGGDTGSKGIDLVGLGGIGPGPSPSPLPPPRLRENTVLSGWCVVPGSVGDEASVILH